MKDLKGKDIAFIALVAACVVLEIASVGAGGLWVLVGFWALCQYIVLEN